MILYLKIQNGWKHSKYTYMYVNNHTGICLNSIKKTIEYIGRKPNVGTLGISI